MASSDVGIRQFLRSIKLVVRDEVMLTETERALDKWTIVVCQALYYERHDIVENAIKVLHEAYAALPVDGVELTEKRLAVAVRLYAFGSLAMRLSSWQTLRSLVLRPAKIHPADDIYVHSSWIRHAHVEASRAGLTKDDDDSGAYLISASRRLLVREGAMRPDVPDTCVGSATGSSSSDVLLNSLCQFDIVYCLLVLTEGQTSVRSMYPSSAAFDESRADPALVVVANDPSARTSLFPNCTDADIAAALYYLLCRTMQEAFRFGGRWWGPPPSVQAFLTTNGQQEV